MRARALGRSLAPLLVAALAPLCEFACERSTPGDPNSAAPRQPTTPAIHEGVDATEEVGTAQETGLGRRSVDGLEPGDLAPDFEIVDTTEDERACLMCEETAPAKPMVIVFGATNDRDFHEDIADIDAVVAKWGFDRVTAVAVVLDALRDETREPELGSGAPRDDAAAELAKLRSGLDVEVRVVRPAAERSDEGDHPISGYHLTRSRTLFVLAPDRRVVYTVVAPEHFREFDRALASLLEPKREASE